MQKPRRSALFVPGSNQRALGKVGDIPADAFIFDLEDAVAPAAKSEARDQVLDVCRRIDRGRREYVVRVNGLATPWGHDDVFAASRGGADALLLPKVESGDMVRQVERLMRDAGAPETMALWCMMETPRGILRAEEIADASPRIACLVMGTSDLTNDLHATHRPDRIPMLPALGLCLLAARAAGLSALDGVHLDLADDAGFEAACQQGRDLGFDGKTLIHPKTVDTCNRVFMPSDAEIAWARRVIDAHEAAERAGKGVVLLDGKLIENLHVADARRVLSIASAG